ncbi:flavoprotein [Streptomyces xinghaiensis]|uniref:flavoprotein n=1 Tax=Streptomyces xinghaiensis TaxID=1038928 RepID=UPI002E0DD4CE|nr:flavoprotein [Streptomyces xinghaiensis]
MTAGHPEGAPPGPAAPAAPASSAAPADGPDGPDAEAAGGLARLLVVGTGSVAAAHLPFWAGWLRGAHPHLATRFVLTRSAERFVTREALTAIGGAPVLRDRWPDEPQESAPHVDLAQWPQAVVVHPATFHCVARLALGLADTPVLLALQCTSAPVVVAPALPPGGAESPAYAEHLRRLAGRPGVTVVPPHPGRSTTSGRREAWAPAAFPEVVARAAREAARSRAAADGPRRPPAADGRPVRGREDRASATEEECT